MAPIRNMQNAKKRNEKKRKGRPVEIFVFWIYFMLMNVWLCIGAFVSIVENVTILLWTYRNRENIFVEKITSLCSLSLSHTHTHTHCLACSHFLCRASSRENVENTGQHGLLKGYGNIMNKKKPFDSRACTFFVVIIVVLS